jgi:antitoxin (DNA-binding transcriptional repressor) of toxin-antitoxin stability system
MIATAKDLRFNINMLFDVLSKGEDVTITYRGKPKAKLISTQKNHHKKDESLFGLWKDRDENVDEMVRSMRKGRSLTEEENV